MLTRLLVLCLLGAASASLCAQEPAAPQRVEPLASSGELLGAIPPLKQLTPISSPQQTPAPHTWSRKNYFQMNEWRNPNALPVGGDPLVGRDKPHPENSGPELSVGLNFDGLRDPWVLPPDPNGDVGKNHYVQMVNSNGAAWFQIWDKNGQSVYGPALTNTLWSQVNTGSIGDPIIQYDPGAERWLMMEMQGFGNNELLIAISDNADPTGGWKAYRFNTLGFPDYPKLYIWPDAYLITTNEIVNGANQCSGFALNKSQLLAGAPSFDVYRFAFPNFLGIAFQPATGADWEGGPPPPPGSPGYVFRVYDDAWNGGADQIQIWEIYVNWQDLSLSYADGPHVLYPPPFETRVCFSGLFDCLEQPGQGSPRITALENIIMYRAPYRNFGSHESVVFNHVVDVSGQQGAGGDAAIRWYELRKSGNADWKIYQQGTYAPDLATNRFTGTLSMDENGNIGMGYSVVSNTLFPGIRLTGRRVGDPLNEMTISEFNLVSGEKSHSSQRFGDYSNMAVDPEDGRTFWFTGQYQPQQGTSGTRIGSFTIERDSQDIRPQVLLTPQSSALLGANEPVSMEVFNSGILPASGFFAELWFENQLVAREMVPGTLLPGESVVHQFGPSISLTEPGRDYAVTLITDWIADEFSRNDTLDLVVTKLTSFDAAAAGKVDLPGLICGAQHTFGFLLRNASGLPLEQVNILSRVNNEPWDTLVWTGLLAPGAIDTVPIFMDGIKNGLNGVRVITQWPNQQADQDMLNDSMLVKFFGNLNGVSLEIDGSTVQGNLHWEVRQQSGQIVGSGDLLSGSDKQFVCTSDETCYIAEIRATTFTWSGSFRLYDVYGNILVEANFATNQPQTFNFCTPVRLNSDAGAYRLDHPVSAPGLGQNEPVQMVVRNFGTQPQSNIQVGWQIDGGAWNQETVPGPVQPGDSYTHIFSTSADLGTAGEDYVLSFYASAPADEDLANDTASVLVWHRAPYDAAMGEIVLENGCNNVNGLTIGAEIFNNGLEVIDSVTLDLWLNGALVEENIGRQVFLAPGQSQRVSIFFGGASFGPNQGELRIRDVGVSGPDAYAGNNTGPFAFEIRPENRTLILDFFADENPEQTRWELTDEQGAVLYAGGPYEFPFWLASRQLCLPHGACYTLTLYDSGMNGLNTQVKLYQSGELIFEFPGGDFGATWEQTFCLDDLCAGFGLEADLLFPSNATATDGSISLSVNAGTPPYRYSLDNVNFQDIPLFENLGIGLYTVYCVDFHNCTATLEIPLLPVGASDPAAKRDLKIWPNPTPGLVWLEMPALPGEQYLAMEVYDHAGRMVQGGRLVRWGDLLRGVLPMENLPAGTYALRVRMGDISLVKMITRE